MISAIFCSMLKGSMMNRGTLMRLVTSMPMYLLSLLGWNSTLRTCVQDSVQQA
jgi:hypothetical protein